MSGKRKILFSTFQKTDVKIGNESIETVSETKLLGTIITDDLKWNKNTN